MSIAQTGAPEVSGTHLLLAVGRRPNTDDLGLEKAGVAVDERGYIVVDDQLRTNVPGIWALGDCNGKGAFTHTSLQRFRNCGGQSSGQRPAPGQRPHPCLCSVHRSAAGTRGPDRERKSASPGGGRWLGKRPMTKVARAVEKGETQGFMKIVVDAEDTRNPGRRDLGHRRR